MGSSFDKQFWRVLSGRIRRSRCGAFLIAGAGFAIVLGTFDVYAAEVDPLFRTDLAARDCIALMVEQEKVRQRALPEPVRYELIRRVINTGQSHQWGYRIRSSRFSRLVPTRRGFSTALRSQKIFEVDGEQWQLVEGQGNSFRGLRPQFSPAFQTLAHTNFKYAPLPELGDLETYRLGRDLARPLRENEFFQWAVENHGSDVLSEGLDFFYESQIPDESEAVFLILHGSGANVSQSGTTLDIGRVLAAPNTGNRSDFAGQVHRRVGDLHFPSAVISLDLPGSGLGPQIGPYMTLESSIAWIEREVDALKIKIEEHRLRTGREKPVPLVVIARSFSGALFYELETRSVWDKVDRYVLIGPEHQSPDFGFDEANERILNIFREGSFSPNEPSLHWAVELGHQMQWHQHSDPMGGTPSLILIGRNDPELMPVAVKEWQRLARENSHIEFQWVEGTAHDVFAHRNREAALSAFQALYRFVRNGE